MLCRIIQEAGFSRHGAVKAVAYACADSGRNAEALVDAGGLREVFPAFMGRGLPHTRKLHGADAAREEEWRSADIVASLTHLLPLPTTPAPPAALSGPGSGVHRLRVIGKFKEDRYEKVDRLVELYRRSRAATDAIEAAIAVEAMDDDEEVDVDDAVAAAVAAGRPVTREQLAAQLAEARDDERYLRRLDAGLTTLQRTCVIIANLCVGATGLPPGSLAPAVVALLDDVAFTTRAKLVEQGITLVPVVEVLSEYGARLSAAATGSGSDGVAMTALAARLAAAAGIDGDVAAADGASAGAGAGPNAGGAAAAESMDASA